MRSAAQSFEMCDLRARGRARIALPARTATTALDRRTCVRIEHTFRDRCHRHPGVRPESRFAAPAGAGGRACGTCAAARDRGSRRLGDRCGAGEGRAAGDAARGGALDVPAARAGRSGSGGGRAGVGGDRARARERGLWGRARRAGDGPLRDAGRRAALRWARAGAQAGARGRRAGLGCSRGSSRAALRGAGRGRRGATRSGADRLRRSHAHVPRTFAR